MDFEAQRRRMAVLCSHLCPPIIDSHNTQIVSTSNCSSDSTRDLVENPNFQKDCVFCKIIQGNSPAFKVYIILNDGYMLNWVGGLFIITLCVINLRFLFCI